MPGGERRAQMRGDRAFKAWAPSSHDHKVLLGSCLKPCNPLHTATVGVRRFYSKALRTRAGQYTGSPDASRHQLSDGRLDLGAHLPLLAQRYQYIATLAEGVSAQVIKADDTYHGSRRVVIKVIKRQFSECALQEISTMRLINSADSDNRFNIIRLLDSFSFQGNMCLVLEELHTRLSDVRIDVPLMVDKRRIVVGIVRKVAIQLFTTFAFLNKHSFVHGDLKPDNILLRRPWEYRGSHSVALKVIDFGNAFHVSQAHEFYDDFEIQALAYRAPEVALGLPFDGKIDMWSIGCILVELALQRAVFLCEDRRSLLHQMVEQFGWPNWPEAMKGRFCADLPSGRKNESHEPVRPLLDQLGNLDRDLASLIAGLLEYDPNQRLSPVEALRHPFCSCVFPFLEFFSDEENTARKSAVARRPFPSSAPFGGGVDLDECPILRAIHDGKKQPAKERTESKVDIGTPVAVASLVGKQDLDTLRLSLRSPVWQLVDKSTARAGHGKGSDPIETVGAQFKGQVNSKDILSSNADDSEKSINRNGNENDSDLLKRLSTPWSSQQQIRTGVEEEHFHSPNMDCKEEQLLALTNVKEGKHSNRNVLASPSRPYAPPKEPRHGQGRQVIAAPQNGGQASRPRKSPIIEDDSDGDSYVTDEYTTKSDKKAKKETLGKGNSTRGKIGTHNATSKGDGEATGGSELVPQPSPRSGRGRRCAMLASDAGATEDLHRYKRPKLNDFGAGEKNVGGKYHGIEEAPAEGEHTHGAAKSPANGDGYAPDRPSRKRSSSQKPWWVVG
mmetsp:Transcript_8337/g.30747  ORF Transcript_8337/g.30747 Transcript_8337/m.30747 type:complete len:785 (+) Transcript_8337:140-2494(+)